MKIEVTPEELFALGREYIQNRAMQDYEMFLTVWDGIVPNHNQKQIILDKFIEDMENMNLQEWEAVMREHFEEVTRKTALG